MSKRPMIYHPQKDKWVEMAETVILDGMLQVRWLDGAGDSGFMSLETAQTLFKVHGTVPF